MHPVVRARRLYQASGLPFGNIPNDSMESYADGLAVNGLNKGQNGSHLFVLKWTVPYTANINFVGTQAYDDMESYSDGASVDGLNLGSGNWSAAYHAVVTFLGLFAYDTMESYADGTNVNGLNGGTNVVGSWSAAYVAR